LAGKARAAIEAEEYDRAQTLLEELQRLDPGRPEVAQLRGEMERQRNIPKPRGRAKTAPHKDSATRPAMSAPPPPPAAPPKDAATLYGDGIAALKGGDLQGAINAFGDCVQVDASFAKCYRALGIAYAKGGNGAK